MAYYTDIRQEAQLTQRDSASAMHVFLGSLNDRALRWSEHRICCTTTLYNRLPNSYRHYEL